MKLHHIASIGMAALTLVGLTSCQIFDAKPAADSGYNRSTAQINTRAQFLQHTWVAKAYRGKAINDHFSAVYIAPVNTRYMAKQSWWQNQTNARQGELTRDTQQIASQMRGRFKQEVANYPGGHLKLATSPGPGVLVLELALVELVPSNAYWNAGATAAGFVIPGASLLSAAGSGSIAIEGRARAGASHQVIATFKDRRADKIAPINIGSFTWYHGAEGNIADWAAEFAELLNTPPSHIVKRPSPVTLKPW
ncbi:MAG: DUF3313 domain-containing protein [Verrucomicrobia bacterium]|nr:MAG: DUF3313 domain-containing protein [Verrucomicrobiota bacterium]